MTNASYKDIAKAVATEMESGDVQLVASALAAFLIEEHRTGELDKILREVENLRFINRGIVEAEVTSARELSEEIEKSLRELVRSKLGVPTVVTTKSIRKDLVGGVVVQAGDMQIDLSVRGQLNRLKQHNF